VVWEFIADHKLQVSLSILSHKQTGWEMLYICIMPLYSGLHCHLH